ncbi:hypothetical protein EBU94_06685, partial [bacterium]|nr:hypothetical protein [bacterium]
DDFEGEDDMDDFEDEDDFEGEDDMDDMYDMDDFEGEDDMDDFEDEDDFEGEDDMDDMDDMEEEEGEYIGNIMMKELADLLDTEVDEENEIIYNGHKINFFSETEKFHVGKKTFETPEEVAEYVQSDSMSQDEEETNERHSHKNKRRK